MGDRSPSHDDHIARRQARDELPGGLTQDPPSPVADDGATDAAPYGEADARGVRRLPSAMVQDEFRTGYTASGADHSLDVAAGRQAVLFTDD